MTPTNQKIAHDLRAPLARAKTLVKMIQEAKGLEMARYASLLEEALQELDKKISSLEEKMN